MYLNINTSNKRSNKKDEIQRYFWKNSFQKAPIICFVLFREHFQDCYQNQASRGILGNKWSEK